LVETRVIAGPKFPPRLNVAPIRTVTRRWISAEGVALSTATFTLQSGHRQFMVETGTNVATPYVDTWRIKSVSLWTNAHEDNSVTVTFQALGTDTANNCFNDLQEIYECSSRSPSEPGHMKIIPSKDMPLGAWHKTNTVNGTGGLFEITANYGGASSGSWGGVTMDIEFEYIENIVGGPQGYTLSTVGISAGVMGGCNLFGGSANMLLQDINILN